MPAFLRKPAKTCGALVVLLRARAGALAVAPSICATTGDVARVDPFSKFVSQLQLYKILEDSMPSNCLTKALLVSSSGVACEEAPSRSSFMLYSCLRLSTAGHSFGKFGMPISGYLRRGVCKMAVKCRPLARVTGRADCAPVALGSLTAVAAGRSFLPPSRLL